jgi:peptide/nickel transport system substrate-binding protein
MWARVGLRVKVETLPKALFFPKAERLDVSAFMVGWGGAVTDPIFALKPLLHARTKDGSGDNNFGDFRIPELDALTDAIAVEMDPARRKAMLLEAVAILEYQLPVLALHRQVIPWVSRAGIEVVHRANNTPLFFTMKMP